MYKKFNEMKKREDGFTLIELLVVIIIVGILAAIAIPAFLNFQKDAHAATVKSDVRNSVSLVAAELGRNTGPLPTEAELNAVVVESKGNSVTVALAADGSYTIQGVNQDDFCWEFASLTNSYGECDAPANGSEDPDESGNPETPAVAAPVITTSSLPGGTEGVEYSATVTATGTTPSFSATGLPDGLSISSAGVISGTPTEDGTFTVTVTASNAAPQGDSKELTIAITAATPPAPPAPVNAYEAGFEGSKNGWDGTVSNTYAHSGTSSLRIDGTMFGGESAGVAEGLEVGANYTATAWFYIPTDEANTNGAWADFGNHYTDTFSAPKGEWFKLTSTFTLVNRFDPEATTKDIAIMLGANTVTQAGNVIYVDDVTIKKN